MNEITPYHAKYFAHELTKRYSSDSLQKFTASLADAQVDLNPHQVDAALFAFHSPLSKGALLADEVGLGKTIEAGIVISQKWAERKRKILIIAPANLRKQWNQELADKFFLPSIILEAKSFNEEVNKSNLNPFDQADKIVICSYHFVKSKAVYISNIRWDLVVIDEAHRLRNVYKTNSKIARAIKGAVTYAPKILLTATPLQNSLLELYGLVSIIDEYTFGDLKSFKALYVKGAEELNFEELKERLKPLCKRTLRRQVLEYINYTNRTCILQEFTPNAEEQQLYDLVSSYLQQTNLYALPPGQRPLMTLILRKLLASSTFAIAGTLQGLANKLGVIITKQDQDQDQDQEQEQEQPNVDQVFIENYEIYEAQQEEWIDEEEDYDDTSRKNGVYTPEQLGEIRKEIEALNTFERLAKSILKNSKGEVLFTALEKGFQKLTELKANRKAIIFTESTRTQEYLKKTLEAGEYKHEIVLFNGSNNDPKSNQIYQAWLKTHAGTDRVTGSASADKRAALVDYFRDTATIMIATEAAAEGINLQFCSLVVNYDLPWNPQRIEQRIGRCHRYGQKFDVVVVNFLNNANAADQRVYELLDEKFKLFNGVFGSSDEILGALESGVDFEKQIAKIYQGCRTTDEIATEFNQLQKRLEPEIEQSINVTRKKLLENFDQEVQEKLKINLQQSKDYLSKFESWLWQLTKYFLQPFATFNDSDNSFFLNQHPFTGEVIKSGPYRAGKKTIGEAHHTAELIPNENLYRVGHPLAQKVIAQCKDAVLKEQELIFDYSGSDKKISIVESLKGKQGWLQAKQLTISSFEEEDYILFAAFDDQGNTLLPEQCQRLFSLHCLHQELAELSTGHDQATQSRFDEIYYAQTTGIFTQNEQRNHQFFDDEVTKLEKWSDDVRNGIRHEIKELDKEIKTQKTEARKLLNLEQKVKVQRLIKELEKKLADKRFNQYQNEDQIENKKDRMLDETEKKLKQHTADVELFTIRWKVV